MSILTRLSGEVALELAPDRTRGNTVRPLAEVQSGTRLRGRIADAFGDAWRVRARVILCPGHLASMDRDLMDWR
jgi:hypothetical protein